MFSVPMRAWFYNFLLDRTMASKGEKCSGSRRLKERLWVLFCCSAIRTMKMWLLVIGKYAKSRCLKSISSFPAYYKANRNALRTKDSFPEWLLKMDLIMER
jgi:hypothetical protein